MARGRTSQGVAIAVIFVLNALSAAAQDFPNRPVTFVVPLAAGGQGNRLKLSSSDEACQIFVVPSGGFASQAY